MGTGRLGRLGGWMLARWRPAGVVVLLLLGVWWPFVVWGGTDDVGWATAVLWWLLLAAVLATMAISRRRSP